jgi:hypothetical protein
MAKELKLQPIVTGAREAADVAADLKAQNVRVIYSLNYPCGRASLRRRRRDVRGAARRAEAPKGPGALAKAGVTFAFASAG